VSPKLRLVLLASVLAVGLVAVPYALLVSTDDLASSDSFDDAYCEKLTRDPENVDVLEWLKDPFGGQKRMGSLSTDEGLSFVHQLVAYDPKRILAVNVHTVKVPEPYQYTEGLVVELPEDRSKRRGLFERYARFVRNAGYRPQPDQDQKFLFLPCRKP
jgi:hypothetical protein